MHLLHDARRPFDAHRIDDVGVAEAEIRPYVVLRFPAGAAGEFLQLPESFSADARLDAHLCAYRTPIGNRADESELDPVVRVAVVEVEGASRRISANSQIEKAIVVVVTPRAGERTNGIVRDASSGHARESPVAIVVVEVIFSRGVGDEDVLPTVVVIVAEGEPLGKRTRVVHQRAPKHPRKTAVTVVPKQGALSIVAIEDDIQVSVIVVVGPVATPRAGRWRSERVKASEGPVAIVPIEVILSE